MDELAKKIKNLDVQTAIKLTQIVDKMGIKDEIVALDIETGNSENDNQELAKKLFSIVISKLYLAENELYEFIAQYKNISVEEAKKVNVIELIKEIFKTEGAADFLA